MVFYKNFTAGIEKNRCVKLKKTCTNKVLTLLFWDNVLRDIKIS